MTERQDERSLGDLFAELSRETSTLVRQELELAGAEMGQRASQAGKSVATLVIGGVVAYAGFLAIIAALVLILAEVGVPHWLSALIVGVLVVGVGYALVARARQALKGTNLLPKQTIQTLREDTEWVKAQTR